MTKQQLQNAIDTLQKTEKDYGDLIQVLNDIINDTENKADNICLIDRNHYIATILWQRDDIREQLAQLCMPTSDAFVDEVLKELSITDMEDCENGWAYIKTAAETVAENHTVI